MATELTVRQNKGSRGAGIVVVRSDQATFTVRPNGVTSGDSVGANSALEVVDSMNIAAITWQVSTGQTWSVARGADTMMIVDGYGHLDFAEDQMRVETAAQETANCVVTKSGGTGVMLIKFHKRSGE